MNLIVISCMLLCGICYAQNQKMVLQNSPIMTLKKTVDKKLCSNTDYSDEVIAKIEDCDRFDPHYKIDAMYKECQEMAPKGQLSWNERRKFNCQIRDCYEQKYQSKEYNQTWEQMKKLSDYEIEKRQIQKFECLEKVL